MLWATIRTTTAIEDLNVDVTAQLQGPICYSKNSHQQNYIQTRPSLFRVLWEGPISPIIKCLVLHNNTTGPFVRCPFAVGQPFFVFVFFNLQ